ncbi:MAG: hypothetical protein IPK87_05015 [Planctomycetes bacterium]|nr:hypothetical protein [Planctomycetota bacterium]
MRGFYAILALLAVFGLASCHTSDSRVSEGEAGEAFHDIDEILTLYILPIELPDEIHGNASDRERELWRQDWPMSGARSVARGVTDETGEDVTALVSEKKSDADFYFKLVITYIDVGDEAIRKGKIVGNSEEGWSQVLATGTLYNGSNGEIVAELRFDQSSGYQVSEPFHNDMNNLGQELGNWIQSRQ